MTAQPWWCNELLMAINKRYHDYVVNWLTLPQSVATHLVEEIWAAQSLHGINQELLQLQLCFLRRNKKMSWRCRSAWEWNSSELPSFHRVRRVVMDDDWTRINKNEALHRGGAEPRRQTLPLGLPKVNPILGLKAVLLPRFFLGLVSPKRFSTSKYQWD
jgi:hypothetical protein